MGVPVFTWEIAFGSLPKATPIWNTNISALVGDNIFSRGRNGDLDNIEAGAGTLTLLDDQADFNPRNADSPYYPNVRPMVPIRQTATLDGITYPLCSHFVAQWPRSRDGGFQTRHLQTVDAFLGFSRSTLGGLTILSGTTGAHVNAVLDFLGWPAGRRHVSAGSATVQDAIFPDGDVTTALSYLQQMSTDESGMFYIDGNGDAVFLARNDFVSAPRNVSSAQFTNLSESIGIPCTVLDTSFDIDHVYNDWIGQRLGGTVQQVTDGLSVDRYFASTRSLSFRLVSDADVLDALQHAVTLFAEPSERIERIDVIAGEDSDVWHTMLALEIGDRVTVDDTDLDGIRRTGDHFVQHKSLQRSAGTSDAGSVFSLYLMPSAGFAEQPANVLRFDTGHFDVDVFGW